MSPVDSRQRTGKIKPSSSNYPAITSHEEKVNPFIMNHSALPQRYIVSKKPKEYLKQGITHCGAFSVKGILSAFGKDDKKRPEEYYPKGPWMGQVMAVTYGPAMWIGVLQSYGVKAQGKNAERLTDKDKLVLLKTLLSKNTPVMVNIGNGYLQNGSYSSFVQKIAGHWITVWGYDDTKEVFYVYDSCVPKNLYDKNIPVGNKMRGYEEMVRDWRGATISKFLHLSVPQKYFYIQIDPLIQ